MTRDEFMDLVYSELHSDGDNNRANRIIDAADSYAEDCEPHWIPCSERLPEESKRYLISALDGVGRRTTVASYQSTYKAWTMTGRMAYWKVVAWMPLPEPYKEDDK